MCLPFLKNAKHKVEDCKGGLGVGDGNWCWLCGSHTPIFKSCMPASIFNFLTYSLSLPFCSIFSSTSIYHSHFSPSLPNLTASSSSINHYILPLTPILYYSSTVLYYAYMQLWLLYSSLLFLNHAPSSLSDKMPPHPTLVFFPLF